MMILSFLSRLVELVRAYAGGDFSEEVVKGNFLLVLELLEDALDWGYPQVRVTGGLGFRV
jgi:AP-2 complex subunit mu-1